MEPELLRMKQNVCVLGRWSSSPVWLLRKNWKQGGDQLNNFQSNK